MEAKVEYEKMVDADCFCETTKSLKRRISKATGFKKNQIVPLEAAGLSHDVDGTMYDVNIDVWFAVNGKGFHLNLLSQEWERAEQFDYDPDNFDD